MLREFIEPMLQRELHQKGLVPEGGGYSAKLVGWVECVGDGEYWSAEPQPSLRRIGSETEPPNLAAEKNTGCGHF